MTATVARDSSTVLLLRDSPAGVEVLMLKRPNAMHFGGAWVFPGGLVDAHDRAAASHASFATPLRASLAARINAHPDAAVRSDSDALGLLISACRETFEETGLLLAETLAGVFCAADAACRARESYASSRGQPMRFIETIAALGLRPALTRLQPWAHWITPSLRAKRFDTRFFVAAAPLEQNIVIDGRESTESAWCRPAEQLARCEAGDIAMLPPTRLCLMDLQHSYRDAGSVTRLLANEAQREVVPILPRIIRIENSLTAVYPWDPDYAELPGAGVNATRAMPQYLQRLPSRLTVRPE